MRYSVFQLSRIGGREINEDRMGYCYTRKSGLFIVADGMGGHPEGEVAAQLALETIAALYQQEAQPVVQRPARFLSNALLAAHHRITRYAARKNMTDTPRTTVVAAVLQASTATWVHCGDSRMYVVRNGELLIRTRDHSRLEQKLAGLIEFEPVNRNILFTCLGSPIKPIFDVAGPFPLLQGDKLMLCSDGLWGSLSDAEIVRQLAGKSVADAVPELVENALHAGGEHGDNVTVLAMEWETPDNFEPTRMASAHSAIDGAFVSTIQAGSRDDVEDDLDDAGIERSIAEINEAIRRLAERNA
jgi:PPM family protein phosphatase